MPLNQAYKGFTYLFNRAIYMLKMMSVHLCFAPGPSLVLSFLQPGPQPQEKLQQLCTGTGRSGGSQVPGSSAPLLLPIIFLGSFLSFGIYHCLNCKSFLNCYSFHCNAASPLRRPSFSTATPVLLHVKPLKSV